MITVDISGFGGGYEICCQMMLQQGLEYIAAHPELDPKFKGFENIFGLLMDDNADAKALSQAVTVETDATGAMHQAVIGHLMRIWKYGRAKWMKDCGKTRWIQIPFETAAEMRQYLSIPANRQYQTSKPWPNAPVIAETPSAGEDTKG
jgi:hypothetical protein